MLKKIKRAGKRRLNSHSLRYQLLSRSLFIVAALLLLIGLSQYWLTKDTLYRSQAEAMNSQMMSLSRYFFPSAGRFSPTPETPQDHTSGTNGSDLTKLDTVTSGANIPKFDQPAGNGKFLGHILLMPDTSLATVDKAGVFTDEQAGGISAPQLSKEEYKELLSSVKRDIPTEYRLLRSADGKEQLVVFRSIGPRGMTEGLIQLGTATTMIQKTLMQQFLTFVFLSILALGGGLALYSSVIRRTLVPLTRMISVVEQIDAGKLDNRFPADQGQQEIDRLSNSFNGMLKRLETSFAAEREAMERMEHFIADASHELRTPLTSIHGFLEVLLRGAAANPEQLKSALHSMHGESRRMNKLVEDLLLLTKFDRDPQLRKTDLSIKALILEIEPHLQMLGGTREVQLVLGEDVRGLYDADKLKQVILNLFQNAVQHTRSNEGRITIALHTSPDFSKVELSIIDNGTGIDEEHLSQVFERFYRNDSSRTRKYGGAGLGLAITKSIVEAHGGTIDVQSQKGKGSTFTVHLPLKKQP
ncbi:MAG: HAMP domain-containing histidine kinase [Gorillibacterium sp.]|nr:HAMP domain-containing histidine kinase [Gorillibacterium sp.]